MLGLAADRSSVAGDCLTIEEMSLLAEKKYNPEEESKYLNHIGGCERCYDEWLILRDQVIEEQEKESGKDKITFISFFSHPKALTVFGTTLAAAASILLVLNIYKEQPLITPLGEEKIVLQQEIDRMPSPQSKVSQVEKAPQLNIPSKKEALPKGDTVSADRYRALQRKKPVEKPAGKVLESAPRKRAQESVLKVEEARRAELARKAEKARKKQMQESARMAAKERRAVLPSITPQANSVVTEREIGTIAKRKKILIDDIGAIAQKPVSTAAAPQRIEEGATSDRRLKHLIDRRTVAARKWRDIEGSELFTLHVTVVSMKELTKTMRELIGADQPRWDLGDKLFIVPSGDSSPSAHIFYGEYSSETSAQQARSVMPFPLRKYLPRITSIKTALEGAGNIDTDNR